MKASLLKSPIIKGLNQKGKLHLYTGYYHLKTGVIDLLTDEEFETEKKSFS